MIFLIKILLTYNEIKNVKKLLHTPKEKIHVELFLPTTSRSSGTNIPTQRTKKQKQNPKWY
jgi:hypothetical protein